MWSLPPTRNAGHLFKLIYGSVVKCKAKPQLLLLILSPLLCQEHLGSGKGGPFSAGPGAGPELSSGPIS